jgi:hypothetical protein
MVLRKKLHFTLCVCEALASLLHTYLGSFFLNPEDFKESKILGDIGNFNKRTGLPDCGTQGPVLRPRCIRTARAGKQ